MNMQILRTFRMIRLLRAMRILICFHELYSLICGLMNCMRTLVWAAGLVFMMLSMWSIVALEYIHPLVMELSNNGDYGDCGWCGNAFSSFMHSNLTLFMIISGDGWGTLSRPLIERSPWTAVFMVSLIFMMIFGILNLITAVVVDAAAQARLSDTLNLGAMKTKERMQSWKEITKMCKKLDIDNNGEITIKELFTALTTIPELQANLSVIGVEEHDIQLVMEILDVNHTGRVRQEDFANQLYKLKTEEVTTSLCFVKHYIMEIRDHLYRNQCDASDSRRLAASLSSPSTTSATSLFENQASKGPTFWSHNKHGHSKHGDGAGNPKDQFGKEDTVPDSSNHSQSNFVPARATPLGSTPTMMLSDSSQDVLRTLTSTTTGDNAPNKSPSPFTSLRSLRLPPNKATSALTSLRSMLHRQLAQGVFNKSPRQLAEAVDMAAKAVKADTDMETTEGRTPIRTNWQGSPNAAHFSDTDILQSLPPCPRSQGGELPQVREETTGPSPHPEFPPTASSGVVPAHVSDNAILENVSLRPSFLWRASPSPSCPHDGELPQVGQEATGPSRHPELSPVEYSEVL